MKVQRLWAIVVVIALVLHPLPAMAAGSFVDYAEELNKLGLFRGTDAGYELDRAPSRVEALVMLIRLLGKEMEALSYGSSKDDRGHPFQDVPTWADSYVSYAYKNGLTNGVAPDRFGAEDIVTASQYFTFVLRALGYSDSAGDFQWDQSAAKAAEIGIVTREDYQQADTPFLRGNLVDISYSALSARIKSQETTLLQKLVAEGAAKPEILVVTNENARPITSPQSGRTARLEGAKLIAPVELVDPSQLERPGCYRLDMSAVTAILPQACSLYAGLLAPGKTLQEAYSQDVLLYPLFSEGQPAGAITALVYTLPTPGGKWCYFLVDEDYNPIAYTFSDWLSVGESGPELTFETVVDFNGRELLAAIKRRATELSSGACLFPNQLFTPSTYERPEFNPEGPEALRQEVRTMVLDRAGLPECARGFTRYRLQGYCRRPEGSSLEEVDSIDDLDVPQELKKEREYYLTLPEADRVQNQSYPYDDNEGAEFLTDWSYTSRFSLLLVMLIDDAGFIRAYTYFTAADLARIAGH